MVPEISKAGFGNSWMIQTPLSVNFRYSRLMTTITFPRWSLLLPGVAAGFALLLCALAALTTYAFEQRASMALQGKILGVAHEIENRLRNPEEESLGTMLEKILAENTPPLLSIRLLDGRGQLLSQVGSSSGAREVDKIDIFTGPQPGPAGPPHSNHSQPFQRGQRGRRSVEISFPPNAGRLPGMIRFLFPLSLLVSLAFVVLARHSGLALERQHGETLREAQARRLEALGRAGAGLAHQLRNPLATIKGSCQLLAESLTDERLLSRCRLAIDQSRRMEDLLGALLDYARPPSPEGSNIDLSEFMEDFQDLFPRLRLKMKLKLRLRADREHLRQILEILFSNAFAHSSEEAEVVFSVGIEGDNIILTVKDRGPGPGDDPEKLFEAYFTTRPDGTGLGLSIARALCEANSGSLHLQPRGRGGTEAVIRLPRAAGES